MDGMSILKSRPIIVKRAFAEGRRLHRTTSSSHAVQPPVMYNLPLTYMNDMYNVQYIDQNPSYSYSYTQVPFHNYPYTTYSPQPQLPSQPPLTFFDPTMQYIQQPNILASGWNMGYTPTPVMDYVQSSTPVRNYAVGSTPVKNAGTNSGKRGARGKTWLRNKN